MPGNPSETGGIEWIIEAYNCDPAALQSLLKLRVLFERLAAILDLHPLGQSIWHRFPKTDGLTGFQLLTESHLACHTFPEYRSLCLNVFSCRRRRDWEFAQVLESEIGPCTVRVRRVLRQYEGDPVKHEIPGTKGVV